MALTAYKTLFGSWLKDTRTLQEDFYGVIFENRTAEEREEGIKINILAATDELHEALNEVSWKPWAKAKFFNREAFIGEIVDVLHFIANLLVWANVSDEELNRAYLEKMERNRQRQREGYLGTEKCSECARAVDDIIAHGGHVTKVLSLNAPAVTICDKCDGES